MGLSASAEHFLRSQRVARLATVDARGRPHVVPIVFAYRAGRLYTPVDLKPKSVPAGRLQRVRNIRAQPRVQVLVDRYEEDWAALGYVQLRGRAGLLEVGAEYRLALRLLEAKYSQYESLPLAGRPVIRVVIERVVAWGRLDVLAGRERSAARRRRPGARAPARSPRRSASRR